MATFWINSTIGPKGLGLAGVEFAFETKSASTAEELAELLATKGVVSGERLSADGVDRGGRNIVRRQAIVLTTAAFLSATLKDPT